MAGLVSDINTENSPKSSTLALPEGDRPTGERHSESRVRENRTHGLMRGGKPTVISLCAFQSVVSRLLYLGDSERLQ